MTSANVTVASSLSVTGTLTGLITMYITLFFIAGKEFVKFFWSVMKAKQVKIKKAEIAAKSKASRI